MPTQKKQLKIGIDARFYGPKQKGLGRYVQKLVENLEKIDTTNQYIIFLRKENWLAYQPSRSNFKKVLADYRWYSLGEQVLMPWKIWQAKVDLMHFPHFNVPVLCPRPFVMTIHDLILKKFPTHRASTLGPFYYWLKNLAYQVVIHLAVKRAQKIIAVSHYTRQDILRYFKIQASKVEVIYEGSPETESQAQNLQSQVANQSLKFLKKYNIQKPYLLYVGNAYPHKNLERLIIAFNKLLKEKHLKLQLVLVGGMDYFYQRLRRFVRSRSIDNIIFTDFVTDSELRFLYQNASLYVFPSLCEGFGLPPLEAMTYCLPVVCSGNSCLPEVLGQAAAFFNPEDINDIADKINDVLSNPALQKELISAGTEKIREYSWSETAQATLSLYKVVP